MKTKADRELKGISQKAFNKTNHIIKIISCLCLSMFILCQPLSFCVPVNAETIDDDIAALEEKIEKLEQDMVTNARDFVKLNELTKEKETTQALLDEKMDRWVYLQDLAERIEQQNH